MSLLPPVGWADVATNRDMAALEDRIDLRFEAFEHRFDAKLESCLRAQTRTFVTWLLASQASTVTMVIAALALFR
jgi:hypothetical protein